MNVFISWSGSRSKAVAELLRDWIERVIQAAKPWLSVGDIPRGATWLKDINTQLKESTIGIFCLTAENKERPWILFEAGAVAKGASTSRVCTLLIDLPGSAIVGSNPLSMFNHTSPNKEGMYSLAETLNDEIANKLSETQLLNSFEAHWPMFQNGFNKALDNTAATSPEPAVRPQAEVLEEILSLVRALNNRDSQVTPPDHHLKPDRNEFPHQRPAKIIIGEFHAYKRDHPEFDGELTPELKRQIEKALIHPQLYWGSNTGFDLALASASATFKRNIEKR